MKIALVTTTIRIPVALASYRAAAPEVGIFIVGDQKTPHLALLDWAHNTLGEHWMYQTPEMQQTWRCSELIGWSTVARRSIGLLEALRWGADAIVYWDDDNLMMSTDYFDRFEMVLGAPFSGLGVQGERFDPGCLLVPPVRHRGFPEDSTNEGPVVPVVNARIGVAAGLCLGDPDIGAMTRMVLHPQVHSITEMGRTGVAVSAKTVMNSQNTAFIRELAPCFLMVPQFSRFDDILASLVAQRVMRDRGMYVHFGLPAVWQNRNEHDLLRDLDAETWGMSHILKFSEMLDDPRCAGKPDLSAAGVIEQVRRIWSLAGEMPWMPPGVSELGLAWCQDCESVL